MAFIKAIQNGDFNDVETWDLGRLPIASDTILSNGFNVNLNLDFTCVEISTTDEYGVGESAEGGFFVIDPITITVTGAGVKASTPCITINTAVTVTINGAIHGAWNITGTVVVNNAAAYLTINGDINPDLLGVQRALQITSIDVLSINGTVYGCDTIIGVDMVKVEAWVTMMSIQGNLYAKKQGSCLHLGAGSSNAQIVGEIYGGYQSAAYGVTQTGGFLTILGLTQGGSVNGADGIRNTGGSVLAQTAIGSSEEGVSSAYGISSTQGSGFVFVRSFQFGVFGVLPILGVVKYMNMPEDFGLPNTTGYDQMDAQVEMVLGGGIVPLATDVRVDVEVGTDSFGSLVVPDAADVRDGVTFDNGTVGTLSAGSSVSPTDIVNELTAYYAQFPRETVDPLPTPSTDPEVIAIAEEVVVQLAAYYAQFPK